MSAVVHRRTGLGVLLAAVALSLGPVLVAAPASAAETSPPVATEPPGGATCVAGSADCGQETGSTTASSTATPTTSPSSTPAVTTLPDTGTAPRTGPAPRQLAHTGGTASTGWGSTGTGLLVGGSLLVLATRRRGSRA